MSSSCSLPFSSQLLLSVPFKSFLFIVFPMSFGSPVISPCCVFFLSFALLFSIIAFSSVEPFSFTVLPILLILPLFHLAVSSSYPLLFSSQLLLSVPFKSFLFTVFPMSFDPPVISPCCVFFLSFALLFSIIAFSSF